MSFSANKLLKKLTRNQKSHVMNSESGVLQGDKNPIFFITNNMERSPDAGQQEQTPFVIFSLSFWGENIYVSFTLLYIIKQTICREAQRQ